MLHQTTLGKFGIGKLGPSNQPISQEVLPAVTSSPKPKRGPGRPRKLPDPAAEKHLQQAQEQQQQQQQQQQLQASLQHVSVTLKVVKSTTTLPWADTCQIKVLVLLKYRDSAGNTRNIYTKEQKQTALTKLADCKGSYIQAARHILLFHALFSARLRPQAAMLQQQMTLTTTALTLFLRQSQIRVQP